MSGNKTESEWLTDETLSSVDHNLRNLLNLLTNYSELLKDDSTEGKKTHVASKQLDNTLDVLMTSLRCETDDFEFKSSSFSVVELIEDRIEWYRSLYEFSRRTIDTTYEEPPETYHYNREGFKTIIDALLVESTEPPGGSTQLILQGDNSSPDGDLRLSIRNKEQTWDEQRTRELEEYLREDSISGLLKNVSTGTGLRLYCVHRLLSRQGGTLNITNWSNGGIVLQCNF